MKKGFTLIELLVVMAILGILATVSIANFRTSQAKGRDASRKSDIHQIRSALEAYVNDHGGYPASSGDGKIVACGCDLNPVQCDWGVKDFNEFCDENKTVYMKEVPADPLATQNYCYVSPDGTSYQIYAILENTNDPEKLAPPKTCGGASGYNFGLSSSNSTP